jgi:hypothetical protein
MDFPSATLKTNVYSSTEWRVLATRNRSVRVALPPLLNKQNKQNKQNGCLGPHCPIRYLRDHAIQLYRKARQHGIEAALDIVPHLGHTAFAFAGILGCVSQTQQKISSPSHCHAMASYAGSYG